jgi:hypothetical protein
VVVGVAPTAALVAAGVLAAAALVEAGAVPEPEDLVGLVVAEATALEAVYTGMLPEHDVEVHSQYWSPVTVSR